MPVGVNRHRGGVQPVPGLVLALARLEARYLRRALAAQGLDDLRLAHAAVLVPLLAGDARAADLAGALGVSRQAVAQLVQSLEDGGYVVRVPDPDDGRAKRISITERGRAALVTVRALNRDLERSWVGHLGDQRLGDFRAALVDLLGDMGGRLAGDRQSEA